MIVLKFLALVPFLLGSLDLLVKWRGGDWEQVRIQFVGDDDLFDRCLKSGLELRYQFEMRLCKRRPAWFNRCEDRRTIRHRLTFDPISQNYALSISGRPIAAEDRLLTFSVRSEAAAAMTTVDDLALSWLAEDSRAYVRSRRSYLSVRAQSQCRGGGSRSLARIKSILTLGLLEIEGFDSGWVDFRLRSRPES